MTQEAIIAVSWWMILPLGIFGSLLHFLFDWTGHSRWAAIFSAVNESYWEHIKIAITPVALLQVILFAAGGHRYPAFVPAATIALYSLPISMVALVFAYKRFTRRNILWLDIAVFFVIIAVAQVLFVLFLEELAATWPTIVLAALFLAALLVALLRFTLRPPNEPDAFIDPINQLYGLSAHPDIDDARGGKARSADVDP